MQKKIIKKITKIGAIIPVFGTIAPIVSCWFKDDGPSQDEVSKRFSELFDEEVVMSRIAQMEDFSYLDWAQRYNLKNHWEKKMLIDHAANALGLEEEKLIKFVKYARAEQNESISLTIAKHITIEGIVGIEGFMIDGYIGKYGVSKFIAYNDEYPFSDLWRFNWRENDGWNTSTFYISANLNKASWYIQKEAYYRDSTFKEKMDQLVETNATGKKSLSNKIIKDYLDIDPTYHYNVYNVDYHAKYIGNNVQGFEDKYTYEINLTSEFTTNMNHHYIKSVMPIRIHVAKN